MAEEIPEILNLSEIFQPLLPKKSKIVGHTSKLLNAPGENYGSLMLAVDVIYEDGKKNAKTLHTVAKLCPQNEWIKRMFATHITFKKEIKFYLELLPTLIQFQKEHGVSEEKCVNLIFPECLSARINLKPGSDIVDENAILLLENLKTKGYNSGNRLIGLNLKETEIVLKDLAKFHAAPLAYKLLKPDEFKTQIFPLLNKINIGQEMFDTSAQKFIDSISKHLDLNEDNLKRFSVGMRNGFEFQKDFPSGNEMYSSIVHRDFWVNNTMILKDENNHPVKNKLLDFQVVTYGSPASDLVFFLYTSVIQSVLDKYYDHFIEVYHTAFLECLQDFHCDVSQYSLEAFTKEIDIYGPLEASHIIIMFRAVYADSEYVKEKNGDFSLDEMFTDDGLTNTYKSRLIWTVQNFFDKKWF